MNRVVVSLWLGSFAIFALGVLLLVQSSIGAPEPREANAVSQSWPGQSPEPVAGAIRSASAEQDGQGSTIQGPAIPGSINQGPASKDAAPDSGSQSAEDAAGGQLPPLPAKKQGGPDAWVTVAGTKAILRPAPEADAPMLAAFPVGRRLNVVGQQDGWTKVEDPFSATAGWIAADQLAKPGQQVASLQPQPGENVADADEGQPDWGPVTHRFGRRGGLVAHLFRHAFGGGF